MLTKEDKKRLLFELNMAQRLFDVRKAIMTPKESVEFGAVRLQGIMDDMRSRYSAD